jgi:hypothetical protein
MPIARWLNAASALLVLGATGSHSEVLAQAQDARAHWQQLQRIVKSVRVHDLRVHIVRPGRLRVTVVERGTVEACWNKSACCSVEGGAAISWILPDGTMVLGGQPVCQLDSTQLQVQLADQSIEN